MLTRFKQHQPVKHLFCHELRVKLEILTGSFRSHKLSCIWEWRRGRRGGGTIIISLPPADFLSLSVIHKAGGKLLFLPDPEQRVPGPVLLSGLAGLNSHLFMICRLSQTFNFDIPVTQASVGTFSDMNTLFQDFSHSKCHLDQCHEYSFLNESS